MALRAAHRTNMVFLTGPSEVRRKESGTRWRPALRTDIEQSAPFPVVGGGWITRARKIPIPGRSASIGLPARKGVGDLEQPILVAGQHRGSTSAIQTTLNALVAN